MHGATEENSVTEVTPPRLAYAALALREPERALGALSGRLGLPRHRVVLDGEEAIAVSAGGVCLLILPPGHPALSAEAEPGIHHLGFETAAPENWLRHARLAADGERSPAALNGIAVVRAYFYLFTGARHSSTVSLKVSMRERFAVLTLAALILGGGIYPQPGVVSRYQAAQTLLQQVKKSK